jgi:uncharacterized membrane protein YphA (DoxX/SURF4 family)
MTRKIILVLRVLLGLVFLYAAYTKLQQPWLVFAMSIDAYQVLPSWAVLTIARTLPWLELLLGAWLIWGRYLRYAAPALTVLLIGFYVLMLRAYGSGIDCGCFGVGEAIGARTLVRDGVLIAASLSLSCLVMAGEGQRRNPILDPQT